MDNQPQNLPAKRGLYFAKTAGSNTWNLIATVFGAAPFFQVNSWSPGTGASIIEPNELGQWTIAEFGPEIVQPGESQAEPEPICISHIVELKMRGADLVSVLNLSHAQQARIVGKPNPNHPSS